MKELSKYIWRWIQSKKLRRKNVNITPQARFNKNTVFEGNNVVQSGAIISNSTIGRNTYISENSVLVNCIIGRFCSIASGVRVADGTHPSSVFVSTCPTFFSTRKQNGQSFVDRNKYPEVIQVEGRAAIVGNDVWIGCNAIVRGGVKIGDGAIVAMGAVVTKDVPPYAIVAGVPARIIKYRFSEDQITHLLKIQWWNQTEDWLVSHAEDFENIDIFLRDNLQI